MHSKTKLDNNIATIQFTHEIQITAITFQEQIMVPNSKYQ